MSGCDKKPVEGEAMSVRRGRAVTVGIAGRDARALADALAGCGFECVGSATDGANGLMLIREREPDLAIAAAIMPGMDGIAFAGRVGRLRLNLRPGVLLLTPPGMTLPGASKLRALGTLTLEAPPDAAKLAAALVALRENAPALPPDKAARLDALMDALGVPPHPGRDCLSRAAAMVWRDRRRLRAMKDDLYPDLARRVHMSPAQVERAIRHVIGVAWRSGDIDAQHRIFGDTIDARRGQPTCGEMIAQLAEELRWEG